MPGRLTGADVVSVEASGADAVAHIRYTGEQGATTVESRWAEVGGEPKIVGLEVTEKT
jgi:hypothetical protein